MLGKGLNTNKSKQSIKKSEIEELQQKDIQRILDEKDQIIRKLEYKVQRLEKERQQYNKSGNQDNKGNYFKQKLELQIKNNDIAIQLLISLNNRISKITELLTLSPEFSEDTEVNNLIKMIGDANGSISGYGNSEDSVDSQSESIQAIQLQSNKKIEELEIVTDVYHKNFLKIQKQCLGVEKNLRDVKVQSEQEIKNLTKQMNELRKSKQQLTVLLELNEKQRNDILNRIANSLDQKQKKQVQKMSRQQLVDYIKKQKYKINELQTTKTQIIRQNKKIKTQDYEKYKKILTQVKQVKEMSRLGQSMM